MRDMAVMQGLIIVSELQKLTETFRDLGVSHNVESAGAGRSSEPWLPADVKSRAVTRLTLPNVALWEPEFLFDARGSFLGIVVCDGDNGATFEPRIDRVDREENALP